MRTFEACLCLEDFKTPEKVGGEEVLIPLKNEAKIKIKRPLRLTGGEKMPQIFKALASISAWFLFIAGLLGIVTNLVMGTLSGVLFAPEGAWADQWASCVAVWAWGAMCIILSVCAMKLRQMLE